MKNIPEVKIGLIVGSTNWLPSDIALECGRKLFEAYRLKYGDEGVYECSVIIDDNEVNIKRAMREMEKTNCNAVCLYWANYGPESAGTLFANEFDGPVMIIAASEEGENPYLRNRRDALSGFINACYAIGLRKSNVYIPSRPCGTILQCAEMIHGFVSIAKAFIGIHNLKLISIGPRPSSYLASCAPIYPLYDLGIDISEYSELELYDSFNKHKNDQRIEKTVFEMESELTENAVPDVLPLLAQYELTIEDWIRSHKGNRKYVTLTSTCWPAFPVSFGFVPCYVNSRITARGYPVACEVDVYGAISEYIGQCISEDVVTILNINNNIPLELYDECIKNTSFGGGKYQIGDLFLGYHCGVTPSCKIKDSTLDYHFVNHQLIGEKQSKGTIQGTIIPGPITMFRIQSGRDGLIKAYVTQGEVLPVEEKTYGGQAIIAIVEMERFIRNVIIDKEFSNHFTMIFGHYGEQLMDLLRLLGVEDISYNHPRNVPYINENVFSSRGE